MIEYPNDMGPLFANTYEYFGKFIPPIHNWSWTDNIQNSVAYMSYETLRQHQTKLKLKIIYLSDSNPTFHQIIEVCRMYNPRELIITSMPESNFVDSNNNINVGLQTIVSRGNINLRFLATVFPDVRHIYSYSFGLNERPDPATFKRLELLSASHVSNPRVLDLITAPKLKCLDMYSVAAGDEETVSLTIPSTVRYLRIDAKVKINDNLEKNKFDLLQYYGACNNLNFKRVNEMAPTDLILGENSLSSEQINELYKTMRALGVYANDKNVAKYIDKFSNVLSIYGSINKHQKATIRGTHLYCNFNIFSRLDVWENVFKSRTWKYIQISKEIVKTNNRENIWPSYPSFNRGRVIRWRNDTLFINTTCHNMESVYALVKKIKDVIDFGTLDIHIRGACMNENTLRMALAGIFMGKIKFQQSPQILY